MVPISSPVVVFATSQDLEVLGSLGVLNVAGDPLERLVVDDGGREAVVLGRVSNFQLVSSLNQPFFDLHKHH